MSDSRLTLAARALVAVALLSVERASAAPPASPGPAGAAPSPAGPASSSPAPSAGPAPGLPPEVALARATAFYEAGEYARCSDAFATLLDDAGSAELTQRSLEQARVYRAACLIAQGKIDAADEQFRVAVRANPQMAVPNAIVFPPSVIERFIVVRTTLLEEIRRSEEERATLEREVVAAARQRAEAERRRVIQLEELAGQETVITKNRRWLAVVPFGVGQFQNRSYFLGSLFLATEAILVGTAITATTIELSLNAQANGGKGFQSGGEPEARQLNQNLETANRVALISTGGFILVAGLGILEANLSFVPEFHDGVRPRATPPRVAQVQPLFAPVSGGGALGVSGTF